MAIGINLGTDDDDHEDGSMFGPKKGSWWVSSKSDPRFNASGSGYVGGFAIPPEAKEAYEAKAKALGVPLPEDLEFGYMKD